MLGGMADVTQLLAAVERGDPDAVGRLWPLVYDELRRLAGAHMARERAGHTLDATALVNEAYLRLAGGAGQEFPNRRYFYAAAAQAMRRILVESARARGRVKRGGGARREQADLDALAAGGSGDDLLDLHDALEAFAAHDGCLGVSLSTAERSWRYARAWLSVAMSGDESEKK
jgi:RNA polymerase sigma factor (TIGR02999 family)